MDKWFVICTYPNEGNSINIYDHKTEAQKDYEDSLKTLEHGFIDGVILIHGSIVEQKGNIY